MSAEPPILIAPEVPAHPVGSRWVWKEPDEADTFLTVVKATPNTVTMRADEGWTVKFGDKRKALRSGKITRLLPEAGGAS